MFGLPLWQGRRDPYRSCTANCCSPAEVHAHPCESGWATSSHSSWPAVPAQFLLTKIDRSTRWTEAVPVVNMSAAAVAAALANSLISCFGMPCIVTSENGAQFPSAGGLLQEIQHQTTANHCLPPTMQSCSPALLLCRLAALRAPPPQRGTEALTHFGIRVGHSQV